MADLLSGKLAEALAARDRYKLFARLARYAGEQEDVPLTYMWTGAAISARKDCERLAGELEEGLRR